ncbi:VaFE repeat-containing surface-anchored protein [Lachnospiraceae bacterium 46-15]
MRKTGTRNRGKALFIFALALVLAAALVPITGIAGKESTTVQESGTGRISEEKRLSPIGREPNMEGKSAEQETDESGKPKGQPRIEAADSERTTGFPGTKAAESQGDAESPEIKSMESEHSSEPSEAKDAKYESATEETKIKSANPISETAEKETGRKGEDEESQAQETTRSIQMPLSEKREEKIAKKLLFKMQGEAEAWMYYGASDFESISRGEGRRESFADACEVDLGGADSGKVWVYAQAYGDNAEYLGLEASQGVRHKILRSMEGVGGFVFLSLDVSAMEEERGTVTIRFGEKAAPQMLARASGSFNTTSTKKLTGLNFTYLGSQPTMYQKKPATGESAVWGNGTWIMKRPTVDKLCSLFGVPKPVGARYTNAGVDGSGNIYMRCTGVTNLSGISGADGGHSGLGADEAYIRCIDIETTDTTATYTFRLWAANGGRGQTTEGYMQISTYTPGPTDISFEKSIKNGGSVRDVLGCGTTAGKAGANFRVYKVNQEGLEKIAQRMNTGSKTDSEWWAGITSKDACKKILPEVVKLMSKDNAKPGEKSPNPNGDYFKMVGAYATGADGRTEKIPVKSGTKDYYMVFERRSPEGLNMGYDGTAGVPEGAHYFYKAFTLYGDGKILMLDAKGDYSLDGGDDMVTIGDSPVLTSTRVGKTIIGFAPASVGLDWKDFSVQVSDNAGFTGNVVSIPLVGEYTTIPNLFVGKVYYLRENPGAAAVTSKVGYKVSPIVYSFYVTEEGKAVYSHTNKANINAPNAVDASEHDYIGSEIQGIGNELDTGDGRVVKVSALPAISEDNPCYSLENAVYKLYRKASPTTANTGGTEVGTLRTKADGVSNTITLPVGYYYAVETEAPEGFLISQEAIPFVVERNRLTTIRAVDMPGNDPIKIFLTKDDSETNVNSPQGGAALEGAEYTVKYYAGYYTKEELSDIRSLKPARTWVYETDANGYISISHMTPIRGDDVYKDRRNDVIMPVGTVSIQETKAPEGYLIDDTIYVQQIRMEENNKAVIATNTKIVKEEPCRGDFKMLKVSDGGKALSDIPFRITSKTTGESHVAVTDEKGVLDTSKTHSNNTNRGEKSEDGVWFGELSALDDEKGALLYDTYVIEELLCENNKDKFMLEPFEVTIEEDSVVKDIGTKENETKEEPKLRTTAADIETSEHKAFVNETTTITDTIEYANLEIGKEYTFEGYLVVKETGEPLLDADGNKITADKTITVGDTVKDFISTINGSADERYGSGTVELSFTFDSRLMKGKSIVVFEDLYLEKFHVGAHGDLRDTGQTIRFSDQEISTTATDKNTGKHYVPLEEKVIINDEVVYKDLIPGHSYKLKGVLMDKSTKQPLLVNGEQVEAEVEFIPEKPDGTVNLSYTLDSRTLEDVTTVVFETLYYKEREIASHADIQDENQEVYFTGVKFKTTLTDNETKGHEGIVNKETTLTDTVSYTGLIPGREYTLTGILMDKKTGKPLLINSRKIESTMKFTPENKEGSVSVPFTFDSTAWSGKSVVAFETLYQNRKEVGVHADINDAGQSVEFCKPDIETTAVDNETRIREAFVNETTSIIDTVHYKNLIPGREYKLSGVLVEQKTGKEILAGMSAVQAETVFTADTSEGKVEVEFTFDSSALKEKEAVVFETLFLDEREIAVHKDLKDEEQTIRFTSIQLETSAIDKVSGSQTASPEKQVTITDTVKYSGLIPGKHYTIKGMLMDKATGNPLKAGGKEVAASRSFQAEKRNGEVEVEFMFDASGMDEKDIVAFEELYYKERLIASHSDLNDENQTVSIAKNEEKTSAKKAADAPQTGDRTNIIQYISLIAAVIVSGGWMLLKRRKVK